MDNRIMKVEDPADGVRHWNFARITLEVAPKTTMHPTIPVVISSNGTIQLPLLTLIAFRRRAWYVDRIVPSHHEKDGEAGGKPACNIPRALTINCEAQTSSHRGGQRHWIRGSRHGRGAAVSSLRPD